MSDDDALTAGALFVGAGIAGYALGRFVIGRKRATATTPPPPPASTPQASTATSGSTAPAAPTPTAPSPTQARPSPVATRPHRPRPADVGNDADDAGPVTSPAEVEPSPAPADVGPVTSPSQMEATPTAATPTPAASATGSARYDTRAARLIKSIPRRVARTRELLAQWPSFLDRYRGGLPRGVFAAVMQMESNGHRAAKGDVRLGEVGLFQITEEFPRSLGLDPRLRYDTEWNFYFAGVEYNQAAARWVRRHRSLIEDGSRDAWLLSRLSFAIGDSGARSHVKRAVQAHRDIAQRDGAYAALLALVREGGARPAGRQSAALVAYRIAVVCPVNFEIGEKAEPGPYGLPVALAMPKGRAVP